MNTASPQPGMSKLKLLLFGLLFVAWMVPGLLSRDPWKADEAYSFGLVLNILQTGDLVVPTLAADPFMEKPPVFFITSAGFAKLLGPLLQPHEAARASCVFYLIVTLLCVGLASRELNGPGTGWLAALLLMGSLGLLHTAHMLMTDNSLVTGYAITLYGLALGLRRPWLGGALCGTGAGLAFLSKGLLGPGAIGVTMACLPLWRPWRTRGYLQLLGGAVLAGLPWILIWPLALYHRSPELFNEWFWTNNLGRFFGANTLGPSSSRLFYLYLLPWFAWPVYPLALWTLWQERRTALRDPRILVPLLAFLMLLGVLSSSSQGRSLYATPMLVPLALLAARALPGLPERVIRLFHYLVIVTFSLLAIVAWLAWTIQFANPAALLARLQAEAPGYAPVFQPVPFVCAVLATIAWGCLAKLCPRHSHGLVIRWTAGVALTYLLGMTLWLPLTNHTMTYRDDFTGLRAALGDNPERETIRCRGLGEPQRAMIHYYLGLRPERADLRGRAGCRWLLIQGTDRPGKEPKPPNAKWHLAWNGRHQRELFALYRLDP